MIIQHIVIDTDQGVLAWDINPRGAAVWTNPLGYVVRSITLQCGECPLTYGAVEEVSTNLISYEAK